MVGLRRESPVAGPGVGHPDDAEIPLIAHGDVVKWPQRRDNPKFDPSVDMAIVGGLAVLWALASLIRG